MRIAQVAPLYESVPPKLYGGTERIVSYLTEELVEMGHDVTLFASGDSRTSAKFVACCEAALRLSNAPDATVPHLVLLEEVWDRADEFDIIHFHTDCLHLPMARRIRTPSVTTLHGRLDLPYLQPLYNEFREMPLVSISNAQRNPLPWGNWTGTVYHGLPDGLYTFEPRVGEYLVFTGRIALEKRPDLAIEIARRAGTKLYIAAKISDSDQLYFRQTIEPLLSDTNVEFLGEINDREKDALLRGALAMLFPIDWPEPFGIVMIESMACGTPVIAFAKGSVPEVITHGESGIVVESIDDAVAAVDEVRSMSRAACRDCFEKRFRAQIMAENYLSVYRKCIRKHAIARPEARARGAIHAP